MPSTIRLFLCVAALVLTALMHVRCSAADNSVQGLDQLVSSQKLDDAVSLARRLDERPDSVADLTLSLARLARELQRTGDVESAAEFYQRSVGASMRPAAAKLAPETIVVLRLAAATVLAETNQHSDALDSIRPTLDADSTASDSQRKTAVSLCLQIGASALAKGSAATASEAYSIAVNFADDDQRATAMLGDAWATAIDNQQPMKAARKLAAFVNEYPEHDDASHMARACAQCLKQAGRPRDATVMLADLLDRWPDSAAALKVVRSHAHLAVDLVPPSVRAWLISKAKANDVKSFDAKTTMLGILIATQQNELAAWSNLTKHLATIDQSGQAVSDLLGRLAAGGNEADAERLAANLIAANSESIQHRSDNETSVTPAAREAACRWAGRTERWSMLALAAESESLSETHENRTVAVERLFAEGMMQTGRMEAARSWWSYLVDRRHAVDFSTLLRCAESETAIGKDAALAGQRIESARKAAGDDSLSVILVDLVDAELSIRRLEFDQARFLLEKVVRSAEIDAGLRGRAQWMIGETYYLQRRFTDAIEAYRRVEGIDPEGRWVSASLIQAGKSFEQLGRTREAAVCYGHLLSRFADTPHAALARRRMAALAPANTLPNDSQPTIRR